MERWLIVCRHRRTGFPPVPHVELCPVELGRYGWYAHARVEDNRNPPLANHQSISQRRNQLRQREQVHTSFGLANSPVLPHGRLRILLRRPGPKRPRPAPQEPQPKHETHPRPPRPLRRRLQRLRIKRLPHARRRNPPRNRHLPRPLGTRKEETRRNRRSRAKHRQEQESSYLGRRRNSHLARPQRNTHHGCPAARPG